MLDLTGRTVVVTGGNGGIGLGLARGVARAGARVAIWARDRDKTDAATKELGQLGAEAVGFACDVSREEDVARCLAETVERFGPVHAGFANAGFATSHDALEMTLAQWRAVVSVNLDGTFLTLRDLARHMIESGTAGKLVAVSPADLEGIAAYLASDEAAFHTGDSIRTDGGYSIF